MHQLKFLQKYAHLQSLYSLFKTTRNPKFLTRTIASAHPLLSQINNAIVISHFSLRRVPDSSLTFSLYFGLNLRRDKLGVIYEAVIVHILAFKNGIHQKS